MANAPYGIWKRVGIIITILSIFGGIVLSYADTKNLGNNNKEDVAKLDAKVDKGFDKIEAKMDEFSHDQTALKIDVSTLQAQSSEIYRMVKFLNDKAKE